MHPKLAEVDVVILSWNRVESTIATIENILGQVNVSVNLWLIDQGSDDSQLRILKEYIEFNNVIHFVDLGRNIGVPAGRNLGMRLGKSDFIFCLDNDAIFESNNALEIAIKKFSEEGKIAIIGFRIDNFFTRRLDHTSWAYPKSLMSKCDELFLTTRFCGAGHAIRRSALEKTSYYDEALFFYWEELDLSYQIINLGYKICYYPAVVILHKLSSEGRVGWGEDRFYYLVRNAIYLNWKYYRSILSQTYLTFGYMLKGSFNGLIIQTTRGIFHAYSLVFRSNNKINFRLNKQAREYIYSNDTIYRGNVFVRIKGEILKKLI